MNSTLNKCTPFPWHKTDKGTVIGPLESHPIRPGHAPVASVGFPANGKAGYSERQLANLALIEAAPELLNALKIAREDMRDVAASFAALSKDGACELAWTKVRAIDAVISKVEGQK